MQTPAALNPLDVNALVNPQCIIAKSKVPWPKQPPLSSTVTIEQEATSKKSNKRQKVAAGVDRPDENNMLADVMQHLTSTSTEVQTHQTKSVKPSDFKCVCGSTFN
jgi:hypothetical protein